MGLGVEYTARRYGLPAKKRGGGIWDERVEDEVTVADDIGDPK